MYRMIFRDGMRYNFGFEFEYADHLKLDLGKQPDADEENDHWPTENITASGLSRYRRLENCTGRIT